MNIGIDIDGVLFPWTDVANEVVVARFGIPDPGPHLGWNHLKEHVTRSQWDWLWSADGQDAVFGQWDRTYPGAAKAVNAILRAGHRVHFVTHRDPRRTAIHTATFLTRHFGIHPWAGVHVIQNKCEKHSLLDWDVFVDDKPETVNDMIRRTDAQVFSPVRPWNDELGLPRRSRLVRYTDPDEVARWVLARSWSA